MPYKITPASRLHIIINPLSGSVPSDAETQLQQRLKALGLSARISTVTPDELAGTIKTACESKPDILGIWGGDGSAACALNAAGSDGPIVLPLPGGTMNMLHTRLIGEFEDWQDVLIRTLSNGVEKPIAAGAIGTHRFYVAAMMGRLVKLADTREAVREGDLITAAQTAANSEALNLETSLTWRNPETGTTGKATALALNVSNDASGLFHIASIDPDSLLQLAQTGMQAVMQGWQSAETVEIERAPSVDVSFSGEAGMAATLDGERIDLPPTARFELIPQAARILVPGGG